MSLISELPACLRSGSSDWQVHIHRTVGATHRGERNRSGQADVSTPHIGW